MCDTAIEFLQSNRKFTLGELRRFFDSVSNMVDFMNEASHDMCPVHYVTYDAVYTYDPARYPRVFRCSYASEPNGTPDSVEWFSDVTLFEACI